MSLSGWCATPPGIDNHDAAHLVCEMRMAAGLLAPCGCDGHRESSTVERDSRSFTVDSGAQSGPESAVTDRGQADYLGVDR